MNIFYLSVSFYLFSIIIAYGLNYWYWQLAYLSIMINANKCIKDSLEIAKEKELAEIPEDTLLKLKNLPLIPTEETFIDYLDKMCPPHFSFLTGLLDIIVKVYKLKLLNLPIKLVYKQQSVAILAKTIHDSAIGE